MTRSAAAVAARPSLIGRPGRIGISNRNSSSVSPTLPARPTIAMRADALNPPIGDAIAVRRVSGREVGGRATAIERDSPLEPAERIAATPAHRARQATTEAYPPRRIAHDFNNLLGVITLNLELAREHDACRGELRELIDEALGAAWQGSELTGRIAGSARRRRA